MTDLIPVARFARGVKLTIQHVFNPLTALQTATGLSAAPFASPTIEKLQEPRGVCRPTWVIPWIGAESAENASPNVIMPFVAPPFQNLFTRARLTDPGYSVTLTEFCLSFDQRAEPGAITDAGAARVGVTADLANRLAMTLRLCERIPSLLSADTSTVMELLKVEIDGEEAFGNEFSRQNPVVVSDLNVQLKPFGVYFWELSCPLLYRGGGSEPLCLPSLLLSATLVSPLVAPDIGPDYTGTGTGVQNLPTKVDFAKIGTTVAVTTPAADAVITGADVQTGLGNFDVVLRRRARSGYGAGFGALADVMQASDAPPTQLLEFDSHYQMILVPMWGGQRLNAVRGSDVATSGLPYTVAPWTAPAFDRFVMPVPEGFVLHHAFAAWNTWSPPAVNTVAAHGAWGTRSASAAYVQQVSVSLNSGWASDDYLQQMVAFWRWNGSTAGVGVSGTAAYIPSYLEALLDDYQPLDAAGVARPAYALMQIPLVSAVARTAQSWFSNGLPFYMGKGNNATGGVPTNRAFTGVLPFAIGGGVAVRPVTGGKENILEVRWSKQDATGGTGLTTAPTTNVVTGQGGEWIILCGKQTVAG